MRCETEGLDQLWDTSNTLVLGPSVNAEVDTACKHLLGDGDGPVSVLAVSFVRSPDQWARDWRESVGDLPDELVVITTTDGFGGTVVNPRNRESDVTTEYVSSPGDLTGVGMIIGKYLERWFEGDGDVRVCFDGLTTILQYGEPQNVYRFLHLMTTRLDGAGASAHFHLDPDTQDERVVATLKSSFQAIAEHQSETEWEVNRR